MLFRDSKFADCYIGVGYKAVSGIAVAHTAPKHRTSPEYITMSQELSKMPQRCFEGVEQIDSISLRTG